MSPVPTHRALPTCQRHAASSEASRRKKQAIRRPRTQVVARSSPQDPKGTHPAHICASTTRRSSHLTSSVHHPPSNPTSPARQHTRDPHKDQVGPTVHTHTSVERKLLVQKHTHRKSKTTTIEKHHHARHQRECVTAAPAHSRGENDMDMSPVPLRYTIAKSRVRER